VLLRGPYSTSTGLMNDSLRTQNLLPATEPYSALLRFAHVGGEVANPTVFAVTGNNTIVDWVLVELRSAGDPTQILATRAALVQRDGDVVDMDGVAPVVFANQNAGSYYVVVGHRNHLRVMTAAPVTVTGASALVDFTNPNTATYGNQAQATAGSVRALWAGDANSDNRVINAGPNNDRNAVLTRVLTDPGNPQGNANYVVTGYGVTDLNLDGKTIAAGPNNEMNVILTTVLTHPGNSSQNANYVVQEQVPAGVLVMPAAESQPAVYVLTDDLFTAEISAASKMERWGQGLPVPLVNASATDEMTIAEASAISNLQRNDKPGLMAVIPSAPAAQAVDGWQEKDFENLTSNFPNTDQSCIWERTQRAGGGQAYIWGKAGDRSTSPTQALWPAGAVNADAPPGTQPLPANSAYPVNMVTSVICKLSGMTNTKNLLAEFQMWYELGDSGDSISLQFFSGTANSTPTYRGGLEWRGVDTGAITQDWLQYRIYYPEIVTNDDTVWVKWKFTSDGNHHAARGPWLDDLSVWRYEKPQSSANCESADPTFATGLSKGLNVPPYAEDIKNSEPTQITGMVNRLTDSDVDWVRLEFKFNPNSLTNPNGEPVDIMTADGYNHIDYRHYDRIIDSLCAATPRIAVLGLVDNQTLVRQDWKIEEGDGIVVPNFYVGDFVDVVSQLVNYYDDRIGAWEVWNEPDHSERRLQAEQYAILLNNTYQEIKAAEPNDRVIFGGLGSADPNALGYALGTFNMLGTFSPVPFTIFAVHPYHSIFYKTAGGRVENDPAYYMRGEIQYRPATIVQKFREGLDDSYYFLPTEQGKAIWATELGWNSSQGSMSCSNYQELVVTQAEQACYLQRGFHSLFNLSPTVAKVFWYQYHDTGQEIKETDCGVAGQTSSLTTLPSSSWVDSDIAHYFVQASGATVVTVPWEFGLYNGNIWRDDLPDSQKKKPVQSAFKQWPATDACMNNFPTLPTMADLTAKSYLPLVSQGAVTASGQ